MKTDAGTRDSDHFVQFYEDEARLADAVANYVATSLHGGSGAVVIATPRHAGPVAQRLSRRGLDLERLQEEGRWTSLDAEESLDRFLVDGMPDPGRFRRLFDPVLDRAGGSEGRVPVRAFGEMVAVLWERGSRDAALALEKLWNQLLRDRSLSLFCAYPLRAFGGETAAREFLDVCGEHEHVLTDDDPSPKVLDEHRRLLLDIQRKATALEAERSRCREIEDLLRRRETEIYDYLEAASEAVVDVGPDGVVRWGNDALRSLLGVDAIEGAALPDFLVPASVFEDVWAKLLRGEAVDDKTISVRDAAGRLRRARIRLGVLRSAGTHIHMRWFLDRGAAAR